MQAAFEVREAHDQSIHLQDRQGARYLSAGGGEGTIKLGFRAVLGAARMRGLLEVL